MAEVDSMLAADAIVGAESLSATFCGKAFYQLRVRMEFWLAAV